MNSNLIIKNSNVMTMPSIGQTNSYTVNAENQCFMINNNYIEPLNKLYNIEISNPFTLEIGDIIELHIKVPIHILGNTIGYNLNNIVDELKNNNLVIGLKIKASNKCVSINLSDITNVEVNNYCGWFVFVVTFQASEELCNICNISYNICFDKIKIQQLYNKNKNTKENVKINSSMCMNLVKSNISSIVNNTVGLQFVVTVTLDIDYNEFIENIDIEQLRTNLINDYANRFNIDPSLIQIIFTEGSVKVNYYVGSSAESGTAYVNSNQLNETDYQTHIQNNSLDTTTYLPIVSVSTVDKQTTDELLVEPLFPNEIAYKINDYDSNYNNSLININNNGINFEISPSGLSTPDSTSTKLNKITSYNFIHKQQAQDWFGLNTISGVTFQNILFKDLRRFVIKDIKYDGIEFVPSKGFELFVRIYVYASSNLTYTTNNYSWYGSSMLLKRRATQEEIDAGEIVFDINPNTLPKLYADNGSTNNNSLSKEDYETIKSRDVASISFQTNSGYNGNEYNFSFNQSILYYQKEDDIERSLSNYYPNIFAP